MMLLSESFALLPLAVLLPLVFVFGAIIGSFLNVYIYRFHTGKSLSGHSHCLSCGTPLQWYELFPLLSFLALRGRCRSCGCRIPMRYFLVEAVTGLLFVGSVLVVSDPTSVALLWIVMALLVVITTYDLYHFIIPDELTAALLLVASGRLGYEWYLGRDTLGALGVDVGAALAGAGFFFVLWAVSRGRWLGFGDVKLAVPLGLLVGAELVFSFVVLSFWIGAGVSLVLISWHWLRVRGKATLQKGSAGLTMKSAVPFAPFLVASALVIVFSGFNVLRLFSSI